jgi:hypothetical protein
MAAVAAISRPLGTSAKALCGCGFTVYFVSIVRVLLVDDLFDLDPQAA